MKVLKHLIQFQPDGLNELNDLLNDKKRITVSIQYQTERLGICRAADLLDEPDELSGSDLQIRHRQLNLLKFCL